MAEDYYKILGLQKDASAEEVQKAYRRLARRYHPDLNPDDKSAKDKFKKIQQAYDVLNDPEKRTLYDQFGADYEGGGASSQRRTRGSGPGGFQDIDFSQIFGGGEAGGREGEAGAFDLEDLFRQFTGGRGRQRAQRTRGSNLDHAIEIPFATSITGGEAQLAIRRPDGRVESIRVKIPAGIEDGKRIRLRDQGEVGAGGGPPGDLYVKVRVGSHPYYRRRGNDLVVTVPVTLGEAAEGAKVDVPTPSGDITLSVPPGTSSGKRLRVKGHGVADSSGKRGDLYAEIQITLPPGLDAEDLQTLAKIQRRHPHSPRADLKW